jgi:hypothetical protein
MTTPRLIRALLSFVLVCVFVGLIFIFVDSTLVKAGAVLLTVLMMYRIALDVLDEGQRPQAPADTGGFGPPQPSPSIPPGNAPYEPEKPRLDVPRQQEAKEKTADDEPAPDPDLTLPNWLMDTGELTVTNVETAEEVGDWFLEEEGELVFDEAEPLDDVLSAPAAPPAPASRAPQSPPPPPAPVAPAPQAASPPAPPRGAAVTSTAAGVATGMNSEEAMQVQFTTFYPKEVKPDDWRPMPVYIYRRFVQEIILADAQKRLEKEFSQFRPTTAPASQGISEGASITATPELPGFQFNPPQLTLGFYKEWHRLDFELRAHGVPLNQSANGRITFTVEGVIVGDIPLSIFVGEAITSTQPVSITQRIYEAVFASYSHKDNRIVERVERALKALGLDYLRDVTTLRSGQHWSEELLQMIDKADIFQLFWSANSATSDYVRQEYEYALKLGRDNAHFIRPVYWEIPMPHPPEALSHLHFAYQPDLARE